MRTEAGTSRLWPVRLPPRPDRSLAAASKEIIARLRKPWRPAGPAKRRAGRPARPEAEVFVSVSLQASPLPPKALSPNPPATSRPARIRRPGLVPVPGCLLPPSAPGCARGGSALARGPAATHRAWEMCSARHRDSVIASVICTAILVGENSQHAGTQLSQSSLLPSVLKS